MQRLREPFAALFIILLAVILIWLPIGTGAIPQIEEWDFFHAFRQVGAIFWSGPGTEFQTQSVRPLFLLPFSLAYWLSTSHLVLHALLAMAIVLKGASMSYVGWWLTRDRAIGIFAGLLVTVYPADMMQMGFRGTGIVWAAALCLTSFALLLLATEKRSVVLAIAATATMIVASLMYEASILLAAAPLALWLARYGKASAARLIELWPVALVWTAAPVVNAIYILLVYKSGSYQSSLLATTPPIGTMFTALFETGLYRALLQCWYDGISMLAANAAFIPYFVVFIVVVGLMFRAMRSDDNRPAISGDIRIIAAGIVLTAFGYAPFLVSGAHINISQRTYLYASIGATIAFVGIFSLLRRSSGLSAAALGVVLLAAGFGSQWEQFAHYTDLSNRRKMYLSGILETFPDPIALKGKTLSIVDQTGALTNTWMLRGNTMLEAISYLYDQNVDVVTCTDFAHMHSSMLSSFGRCVDTGSELIVAKGLPTQTTYAKDNLVSVTFKPDGTVERGAAKAESPAPERAARWRSILGCFPCTYSPRAAASESMRYNFGNWWSLEDAPWGAGWLDVGWHAPPKTPLSYSWMIVPESNLHFRIAPVNSEYVLALRIVDSTSTEARNSLKATVNGRELRCSWPNPNMFECQIAIGVLHDGLNEVALMANTTSELPFSNAVDWINVSAKTIR